MITQWVEFDGTHRWTLTLTGDQLMTMPPLAFDWLKMGLALIGMAFATAARPSEER